MVRGLGVSDGEEEEGVAEGGERANFSCYRGVGEELEGYPNEAEDRHSDAEGGGAETQTTGKGEGEGLRVVGLGDRIGRVEARGREKDDPLVWVKSVVCPF